MLFSIAVTLLFLSFFASVVLTGYFRNIARANKVLIDIPDKSRKFHFRPTPLIGGLSIHASMLLSSMFMLFLIDYKYDFQFDGFSLMKQMQVETPREVNYSKKLSIKNEDNGNAENYRLKVTHQQNSSNDSQSYDVDFGSNSDESLNIAQVNENTFNVTLPNGQIKTFQAIDSKIVELDEFGEMISQPIIVESETNQFFSFSSFTAAFILIAIALQVFILIEEAF